MLKYKIDDGKKTLNALIFERTTLFCVKTSDEEEKKDKQMSKR